MVDWLLVWMKIIKKNKKNKKKTFADSNFPNTSKWNSSVLKYCWIAGWTIEAIWRGPLKNNHKNNQQVHENNWSHHSCCKLTAVIDSPIKQWEEKQGDGCTVRPDAATWAEPFIDFLWGVACPLWIAQWDNRWWESKVEADSVEAKVQINESWHGNQSYLTSIVYLM